MAEKAYYTTSEAAAIWRVSDATVLRHAESLGGRKVGDQWRFSHDVITGTWRVQQAAIALVASPEAVA